jgi:hypothetical protein
MSKTGRQYMDDHIQNLGMTRLINLKKGDKFYHFHWDDNRIFELVSLTRIQGEENEFQYQTRELGTDVIKSHTLHGDYVVNRTLVCKYRGKDRGSFIAGFKAAMQIYQKHMQVFDQENAGLDNRMQCYITMNQEFRNWKQGH